MVVCSHESQFEGRLWTHFQMDFMNTVQMTQGKTSEFTLPLDILGMQLDLL